MLQGHNIISAINEARRRQRGKKTTISMSRQRLMRILNGKSKATITELEAICSGFGLQLLAVDTAEMSKIQRILAILGEK
jgi:DNA-binding phage protein